MDNNNNTDQNKPDYSFITEQPSNGVSRHSAKQNKKAIVLVSCLVFLFVTITASAIFGASENVKQEQTNQQAQNNNVVNQFFKSAADGDQEKAYSFFASSAQTSKEQFRNQSWPFLQKMKLSECAPKSNNENASNDNGRTTIVYTCFSQKNNFQYDYEFIVISETDVDKILFFNLLESTDEQA